MKHAEAKIWLQIQRSILNLLKHKGHVARLCTSIVTYELLHYSESHTSVIFTIMSLLPFILLSLLSHSSLLLVHHGICNPAVVDRLIQYNSDLSRNSDIFLRNLHSSFQWYLICLSKLLDRICIFVKTTAASFCDYELTGWVSLPRYGSWEAVITILHTLV